MPKLSRFRTRTVASKCGHKTLGKGEVTAFGQTVQTIMPLIDGSPEYCLDCIGRMAVQCAWCSLPIFVGDAVTLYSPREADYEIPSFAVVFSREPVRLVGCLRWDCMQTGADQVGFWLPDAAGKGHVRRVPTIFEQMLGGRARGSMELMASSDPSQREPTRRLVYPIDEEG